MADIFSNVLFYLINGLIWGLIIALISLGLSMIFGVMGIVNMAHGDVYMCGAVLSFYVVGLSGSFWLSILLVPILVALVAAPTERYVLRTFEGHPSVTMIATVGISFILQQGVLATYGGIPKKIMNPWPVSIHLLGVDYPGYRLLVAALSLLIICTLWLFLYRTNFGILIRASMQDRDMASAMGINVNRVLISTFVLGTVLASIGGVLAAPIYQVFYLMGQDVIMLSFIVVIIGGLGSLEGTLISALILCTLESLLAMHLSPTMARAAIFTLMVVVLMVRPRGLLGQRES